MQPILPRRIRTPLSRRVALAASAAIGALMASAAHAEVPNNHDTPSSILDPNDVTGIGQMVTSLPGGGIGTCTGTLINPRTVIFAAHCVNENIDGTAFEDPSSYPDPINIAFAFRSNNLKGMQDWLSPTLANGDPNPNYLKTNLANYFYNVSQVAYNPISTTHGLDGNGDAGDIAIATLDTPAAGVPTWALLFSALPAPSAIGDHTGTGYHVVTQGYGMTGNGTDGAIDTGLLYRRRIAENMLGALGSLNDLYSFFGDDPAGVAQNVYWLDFDDPARGTGDAFSGDYNLTKDDATPHESSTGEGDSGGPLILDDTFDKPVVIGTLSAGLWLNGNPESGYGSLSWYQPLYLYWDWIAANNPYHYVAARAGDGNWTDPDHWVTKLDPAYQVIDANGGLVNGIPTSAGTGQAQDDSTKFGQFCVQGNGDDICLDLHTGVIYVDGVERPDLGNYYEEVATPGKAALPGATLENGLPGATGFVPQDIDPNPASGVKAAYFDVTLEADGTTTLDTAATVDRFTLAGTGARLDITSGGSLTSLIDVTQYTGVLNVDGNLTSAGDVLLVSGLLKGHGTIVAPYLTNVAGTIAPGGAGTTGTLTVQGNVVLASGSVLAIDIGPNGAADKLAVQASVAGGSSGVADLGGMVALLPTSGTVVRAGDSYRIVTAEGGIVDSFAGANDFSVVLKPQFVYGANYVDVEVKAAAYADLISPKSAVQSAYATLLDLDRANQAALAGVYTPLDLSQTEAAVQATLEAMAPRTETLKTEIGVAASDGVSGMIRERLATLSRSQPDGEFAMVGRPLDTLAARALGTGVTASDYDDTSRTVAALPEGLSGFLTGGYVDGRGQGMTGAVGPTHDDFDGFAIAAGLERHFGEHAVAGVALSYSDLKGDTSGGSASGQFVAGTIYGRLTTGRFAIDGQLTAGNNHASTRRALPLQNAQVKGTQDAFTLSSEVGASAGFGTGTVRFTPRIAARLLHIGYGDFDEQGPGALAIARKAYTGIEGRAGFAAVVPTGSVRPFVSLDYVHAFDDRTQVFGADFVGGTGATVPFALTSWDKDWGEAHVGLTARTGKLDLSLSGDTSIARSDIRTRSIRGSVRLRF